MASHDPRGARPRTADLTLADLLPVQARVQRRRTHRQKLIAHRRERSLALGPSMRLQFEDELTVNCQMQEMLHSGQAASPEGRLDEIDTYAHLLPDGSDWKATLLIELHDAQQRGRQLPQLSEAAHRLYIELPHQPRVFAQTNEDLPDRHLHRPSAVHFLRFQFQAQQRIALLDGASAMLGCAHDQYAFRRLIPLATMARLRRDLVLAPHD